MGAIAVRRTCQIYCSSSLSSAKENTGKKHRDGRRDQDEKDRTAKGSAGQPFNFFRPGEERTNGWMDLLALLAACTTSCSRRLAFFPTPTPYEAFLLSNSLFCSSSFSSCTAVQKKAHCVGEKRKLQRRRIHLGGRANACVFLRPPVLPGLSRTI